MGLLHQRIPLTLLHDLWNPDGPESWEILAVECGWLDPRSLDRLPSWTDEAQPDDETA